MRIRAAGSSGVGIAANGVLLQVVKPDYPGCPGAQMPCWKYAAGRHSVDCCSAHPQGFGGFVECDLSTLSAFAIAIHRNAMRVT